MPYIDPNIRPPIINAIASMPELENCGELNCVFTMVAKDYLKTHDESYQTYNDIIGALACCQLELYRRKVALYEDGKIKVNGDVY